MTSDRLTGFEVGAFPLKRACELLSEQSDDGPLLAEIYRLAAVVREPGKPSL